MATAIGQLTFVITEISSGLEDRVTVDASEFDIESEQTDTEDDKRRESVHLTYRGTAFDEEASFTVRLYYDVFGANVFRHWSSFENVTPGYKVTVAREEPDDGLTVEATPLNLNEQH